MEEVWGYLGRYEEIWGDLGGSEVTSASSRTSWVVVVLIRNQESAISN